MMNYPVTLTTEEATRAYLGERLEWMLDLMDKEHHHATTHAQRNAYQAVIRIELEVMRSELRSSASREAGVDWVPF